MDAINRHAHVWVSCSLALVLLLVCVAKRKRPGVASVIEVTAYGAALWGASHLFLRGAAMASDEAGAWESVGGSFALAAAAIYGLWDSLKKI